MPGPEAAETRLQAAAPGARIGPYLIVEEGGRGGMASPDPVGSMAADWIIQRLEHTGLVEVVPFTAAFGSARHVIGVIDASDTAGSPPTGR